MTDQIHGQDVELNDDENEVNEAQKHDPKNAEAQSVAATDKAADATKQAPARKGDKKNSEKMPKTKAGMINAMYSKMSGMKKDQLQAMYKGMNEDADIEDEAGEDLAEDSYDFSTDLNALVESEATLSEGFREKAGIIFETAVRSKISEEIENLEEYYETELEEEISRTKEDLVEKVDGYLNYVVESWMEENKLAIQNGLRSEIAEGFMGKLKDLFVESYIEVPDSKVDLVDDLAEQVDELEEKLNSQTGKMIQMSEELEQYKRTEIVLEHSNGLADTEVEKLAKLVEDIDFDNEETFANKVKTIKESYFKKPAAQTQEESIEEEAENEVEVSNVMESYISALRKTSK